MIISHKYKFIFIKTKKTAGTSIEVFLSSLCGQEDVVTPIYPHVEPHVARNYRGVWNPFPEITQNHGRGATAVMWQLVNGRKFFNHMAANTVQRRVQASIWNTYYKFCVERNPWDKTLSHYHMMNGRSGGEIPFDDYLKKGFFPINHPLYTDRNDQLLVDEVIKYESLSEGLSKVFNQLGIPFDGNLGIQAKSESRKSKRPYKEVYTREQAETVTKAFSNEIELHGYSF